MELDLYPDSKNEERELISQWFDTLKNELSSLPSKDSSNDLEDVNKLNWEALLFFKHLL